MPRPPKTPTRTKTPTSEERRAAIPALRETLDDVAIGRALNLSPRRIRRDAGPRSAPLPAASEPGQPAPKAKPAGAPGRPRKPAQASTARGASGTFRSGPPPGKPRTRPFREEEIPRRADYGEDVPVGGTGPLGRLVSRLTGSTARGPNDGMQAVAAYYDEQDLRRAREHEHRIEVVETEDQRGRPCIVVEVFGGVPPAQLRRAEEFALLEAGRR
jgi:hypothetical protein